VSRRAKQPNDARYSAGNDLSGFIDDDMIFKARAEIDELKAGLKRFSDDANPLPPKDRS
jgi:hypothetical protein